MQFSEKRLRQRVNIAVNTAELAHRLTMAGLEVDAVEPAVPSFRGVVIGEVLSTAQHPNADKLKVTQVNIGAAEPLQIVCGASNVRAGLRVAVATVGAVLPGDFHIQPATLRGVASQGMLCAEEELGLADQSDGLWELPADAPIGADLRSHFDFDDNLITLGLTPNRGDCLSLRGLAREAAAVFETSAKLYDYQDVEVKSSRKVDVSVLADRACPRYLARAIDGVNAGIKSPYWLIDGLRRYGVRSVSPLVDVTQWVMLELGQPMHAFDADKVNGALVVRFAHDGESLTLLNEQTVTLKPETLVIADDSGAIAIAGVMGGASTAVSATTTNVLLESAFFAPLALAGQARRYGLHTDASHRFERGVDPALPQAAMVKATALIVDICGGQASAVTVCEAEHHLPARTGIVLRANKLARLLGFSPDANTVNVYLQRLGMTVKANDYDWLVTPPSHRFDIQIEEDLIEEVARLHGYNALPVATPLARLSLQPVAEAVQPLRRFKRAMVDLGYQEAVTFSFIEPGLLAAFTPDQQPLTLANPISSDLAAMRTSLLPSLLQAVKYNQSRQQARVRLFESGLRFSHHQGQLSQEPMVAGVLAGSADAVSWLSTKRELDFFDIKGNIEQLCTVMGVCEPRFVASTVTGFHPGQCAQLWMGSSCYGVFGAIHPTVLADLGIDGPVYAFELSQQLFETALLPRFSAISRYPEVARDLALVVPAAVKADAVVAAIESAAGEALQSAVIFDVYRGEGVPEGYYSLAIALVWQLPERTLQDEEVQASVDAILRALAEHHVVLR